MTVHATPADTGRRARELFGPEGLFCAEAVLLALAEKAGVDTKNLPRMATGFCSGVSRTSGMCGAASGAVMGLGLAFGRDRGGPDSLESVGRTYERVQAFLARFRAETGGMTCLDLSGCDMATDEGQAKFKAENGIDRCRDYVEIAARLAAEVMEEGGE